MWKGRLLTWDLFVIQAFLVMNFPLSIALAASYNLWYVIFLFSFISMYFLTCLVIFFWPNGYVGTHCLSSTYLWIPRFLLLIYNFLERSEDILCMISILLNLLSLVLWPSIWFILDCIPCAHSRTSALWVGLCGRRGSWPLGGCLQRFSLCSLFNIPWLGADGKGSPIFLAVPT